MLSAEHNFLINFVVADTGKDFKFLFPFIIFNADMKKKPNANRGAIVRFHRIKNIQITSLNSMMSFSAAAL